MKRQKKSKHNNVKTEYDGKTFDSMKEARRYRDLKLLEKHGKIKNLRCQVVYPLCPPIYYNPETKQFSFEKRKGFKSVYRKKYYRADFVYDENGKTIVEDVKGHRTEVYKQKRRLMKLIYGIEILET